MIEEIKLMASANSSTASSSTQKLPVSPSKKYSKRTLPQPLNPSLPPGNFELPPGTLVGSDLASTSASTSASTTPATQQPGADPEKPISIGGEDAMEVSSAPTKASIGNVRSPCFPI